MWFWQTSGSDENHSQSKKEEEISAEEKIVGDINLSTNELNVKWTIKDAKNIFEKKRFGEYILSPPIVDGKLTWYISLYPSGQTDKSYVSLFLGLYHENDISCVDFQLDFEFSVLNEYDKIMVNDQASGYFKPVKDDRFAEFSNGKYSRIGMSYFLLLSDLKKYLRADKSFLINCTMKKIFKNKITDCLNENSINVKKNYDCDNDKNDPNDAKFNDNFKNILNDAKFSDLELIVENKTYSVHKVVLASKSPIFVSILESNENNKKQVIEINNLNGDAVREMLRYIYTSEVENVNELAPELLVAADKYDIIELKKLCEKELINKITVENAIDFFILASEHSAKNLRIEAINVIANNIKQLSKSTNWRKLNPESISEIISALP